MTIVFFSTPAYGHLFPVLPVLTGLVSRGHRVLAYSTAAFGELVASTGAEFREYPFDFSRFPLDKATADFLELYEALLAVNEGLIGPIEDLLALERPELVLHDSLAGFAKHACGRRRIPAVCLMALMAFNHVVTLTSNLLVSSVALTFRHPWRLLTLLRKERRYRKRHGQRYPGTLDLFVNREALTLVFTPEFFQPWRNTFDRSFVFVGTTIPERLTRPWGRHPPRFDRPVAYVSLGTIFSTRRPLLSRLASQLAAAGYQVVVSGQGLELPPGTDKNAVVQGTGWNQLEVLSRCALFVNHGGLNGVLEALWFGVPQIFIPQQEEQKLTARRAARLGWGVLIKHYTPARLSHALKRLSRAGTSRIETSSRRLREERQDAVPLIEEALKR
jgi:MGT family glycosyltransferase